MLLWSSESHLAPALTERCNQDLVGERGDNVLRLGSGVNITVSRMDARETPPIATRRRERHAIPSPGAQ